MGEKIEGKINTRGCGKYERYREITPDNHRQIWKPTMFKGDKITSCYLQSQQKDVDG